MKSVALVFAWVVLSLTCQKTVECTNTFFTIRNATSDLDIGCLTYLHRNERPFNQVVKPILLHLDEECTDEDHVANIFEDAKTVSVSCNCAQTNLSLTSLSFPCTPAISSPLLEECNRGQSCFDQAIKMQLYVGRVLEQYSSLECPAGCAQSSWNHLCGELTWETARYSTFGSRCSQRLLSHVCHDVGIVHANTGDLSTERQCRGGIRSRHGWPCLSDIRFYNIGYETERKSYFKNKVDAISRQTNFSAACTARVWRPATSDKYRYSVSETFGRRGSGQCTDNQSIFWTFRELENRRGSCGSNFEGRVLAVNASWL